MTCGADVDNPVLWGFSGPDEVAPGLMRVLLLCETCRARARDALAGKDLGTALATSRQLRAVLAGLASKVDLALEVVRLYAGDERIPLAARRRLASLANALEARNDEARKRGLGGRI